MISNNLIQARCYFGDELVTSNHVYTICTDKTDLFMELVEWKDSRFMTANQVEVSFKEDTQVYML